MEKSHVSGTEIEDISMHSNLVMAYEDHDDSKLDNELKETAKSPELRSVGRSLSKISQLGGQQNSQTKDHQDQSFLHDEDPILQNFFRKGNAKFTVKTAGFGNMNESMKLSNRIKEAELESEESSSDGVVDDQKKAFFKQISQSNRKQSDQSFSQIIKNSSQNSFQNEQMSPKQLPLQNQQRGRGAPRVTFMGDRKNSLKGDEETVIVPRQQSNRSLTYTSRTPIQEQQSSAKPKHSQNSHSQDLVSSVSIKKMEDNENEISNHMMLKKQRSLIKRKSTKTNTRISMIANNKENSVMEMTQTNTVQEQILDMDRMHLFQIYFPLNNYDVILKKYSKLQKYFGKKRLFSDFSPYSFSFLAIKLGAKLRRALEKKDYKVQQSAGVFKEKDKTYQKVQSSGVKTSMKKSLQLIKNQRRGSELPNLPIQKHKTIAQGNIFFQVVNAS